MPLLRRCGQLSVRFLQNWILLFSLALLAPYAAGQATGRLSGTVQDAGGRPMAGARVSLSLAESSVVYSSTITNHSGGFFFGLLRAGTYDLVVEATSFGQQTFKDVKIDPAIETVLPPVSLANQLAVEAKAPESPLQTASVDIAFPASRKQVSRLPLPRRNPLFLINTLPGVADNGRAAAIDGESLATANITYDGVNIEESVIRTNGLGPLSVPLHTDQVDEMTLVTGAIYGCGYHELLSHCFAYIHATEVGGTHPALIEAMGRGAMVLYLVQTDYTSADEPLLYSREYHLPDAFDFIIWRRGPARLRPGPVPAE